jgi:hypothetical protein
VALKGEFDKATPQLQRAIEDIGTGGFPVTSIISGPHKGDAHKEGRAIDIGISRDKAGYDYIVKAIESGEFSAIGTDKSVVDLLQPIAKEYGVDLFEDDEATGATGLHVHLQTGPL